MRTLLTPAKILRNFDYCEAAEFGGMGDRPAGWHQNDRVKPGILLPRPFGGQESLNNRTVNVRLWLKTDVLAHADQCPLGG